MKNEKEKNLETRVRKVEEKKKKLLRESDKADWEGNYPEDRN